MDAAPIGHTDVRFTLTTNGARAPLSSDANWRCTPGANRQAVDVAHV
jgi:hypothetical protein